MKPESKPPEPTAAARSSRATVSQPSGFLAWVTRLVLSVLAALAGAALVAFFEARSVGSDAGGALVWSSLFGLLVPLAIPLGIAVGALAQWLAPPERSGLLALRAWDAGAAEQRRLLVARAWLAVPAFLVGMLAATEIGLGALVGSDPVARVAASALGLMLLFTLLAGAVWALAEPLASRLPEVVRPSRAILLAVAVGLSCVVVLAVVGETSGAGGAFRRFGVLRREELDLRAPGYLMLIALMAYQLPSWGARVPLAAALAVGVLAPGVTWGAGGWLNDMTLATAVERHTALGKPSLRLLRRLDDRDGDGFAARFGGGDCNDRDPTINPLADDIPGNGIDEDCSGSDAAPLVEAPEAEPSVATAEPNAAAGGEHDAPKLPERLNVVLLTVDTLRYDIGFTGYPRKITPNIDALAARSVYFDNAYALASYTSKSLGPMLIGRYGSETYRGKLHFSIFQPRDKMLQERLRAGGIRTVSVQGHWYFRENTGLGRGFDVLDMSAAPAERQGEGDRTINSHSITDAALKQLPALIAGDQQFFLWVHYLDPHAEYVPHADFDFGRDERARYDGEVAFTDHHVGRVIDAIQSSPVADRTVIIVTSDHGEAFGEHGMMRHGFELWDVLLRVPLLVHVPGVAARRLDVRRSLIDLTPTVLEMYGLEVPGPDGVEDYLSGHSMLKDVLAPPGYVPSHRPIFMDMPGGPFVRERQAFIDLDGMKLITHMLQPMGLYDVVQDPGENNNLVKDLERTRPALERMKQFRRKLRRVEQ